MRQIVSVDVTAEDIRLGQDAVRVVHEARDSGQICETCAVSRAIQRTLQVPLVRWFFTWGVVLEGAAIAKNLDVVQLDKLLVDQFVINHDHLQPVEPFSFTLNVDDVNVQ